MFFKQHRQPQDRGEERQTEIAFIYTRFSALLSCSASCFVGDSVVPASNSSTLLYCFILVFFFPLSFSLLHILVMCVHTHTHTHTHSHFYISISIFPCVCGVLYFLSTHTNTHSLSSPLINLQHPLPIPKLGLIPLKQIHQLLHIHRMVLINIRLRRRCNLGQDKRVPHDGLQRHFSPWQ